MEAPVKYVFVPAVLLGLIVVPQTINALPPVGGLDRVNHIIVLTQENHSFDNYFGVLPYTTGANYRPAAGHGPCDPADHQCVDGLTCTGTVAKSTFSCSNSNPTFDGGALKVVEQTNYCSCNPEHEWVPAHQNANYENPNSTSSPLDGFARTNAKSKKLAATVMSFYTEVELPYYYKLAETFSISDRHFSSVIGPTLPNRMYQMAATSFGHVVTDPFGVHGAHAENIPPEGGYRPKNGTIFDLLDKHKVSWAEFYEWKPDSSAPLRSVFTPPRPYGLLFRQPYSSNFKPLAKFFEAAEAGTLPQVAFVDLNQHEHPPYDIRRGQHEVALMVEALRTSPNWKDSILFLTYDENGGFYDHVAPPAAVSPDDIPPGKCADKNNPPNSEIWGSGANCEKSKKAQDWLCPSGKNCADFNRLGFRVPLIAISPFAKQHYVSHVTTDHTSLLALIEKRFLDGEHLTKRDTNATAPEDMFDFATSPSLKAGVDASLAYEVSDGLCQTPIILKLSKFCN